MLNIKYSKNETIVCYYTVPRHIQYGFTTINSESVTGCAKLYE